MAEGGSSDCQIVPTGDSRHRFLFRVRPGDGRLSATTIVAGRKCKATYVPLGSHSIAVCLNVCPTLDGAAKMSTHMVLLDKTGSPAPSVRMFLNSALCPDPKRVYDGLLIQRDQVKLNCVVDNYFEVLCTIDITWKKGWTPPEELPGLGHHLASMFGKQDLTDVTFDVGGESFCAHRLVLAAQSPVFRAELYGPMAESKMTSITIKDMEASTFRSFLHYMYHGLLPDAEEKDVPSIMAQCQHLLVAADRYGVEGLKNICEDKLCGNDDGITADGVVSMLELAEAHVCPKLKAHCFDFLADDDNFRMVATTAEYLHLMQTFPTLLVEARERFKIAHGKSTIMEPPQKRTRVN